MAKGKKIITYPRAEVRYLPQSLILDVPRIVAGLRVGQSFSAVSVPEPPVIRKGASGTFYDKGLEGASHHAVIPNVNTIDKLREAWPRLSSDEKKLFDVIARAYLAALMPDFRRSGRRSANAFGLLQALPQHRHNCDSSVAAEPASMQETLNWRAFSVGGDQPTQRQQWPAKLGEKSCDATMAGCRTAAAIYWRVGASQTASVGAEPASTQETLNWRVFSTGGHYRSGRRILQCHNGGLRLR